MTTTFDKRLGQRFMVGFEGLTAPQYILDWLAEGRIGGVIFFARNVESPQQLADLCRSLHEASETPIFIAIDQEGGMVARMRQRQGFTESSGAMALAAAQNSRDLTESISRVLADEMCAVGINWTFAPVLDLSYNAENPTVGTRSFGRNPKLVGELAAAATRGFQAGGVMACAKHFPGLGNTSIDSHLDLPTLDTPIEQLTSQDLEPYRHVVDANIASIMTTHTVFTELDTDYPATLSPHIITNLVREELGFEDLVITDCLEMHAITKHYGEGESSVLALAAGVDIALVSHTKSHQEAAFEAAMQAVADGRISDTNLQTAHERIQRMKAQYTIDTQQIDPELVNTEANRQKALTAAQAGISMNGISDYLPLSDSDRIAVVEFASYMDSEVMERDEPTSFAGLFLNHLPNAETVALHAIHPTETQLAEAKALVQRVDKVVVVTRNAHMVEAQQNAAQQFLSTDVPSFLLALRNPYDADVLQADTTLCTFGDSIPSLEAAALALVGDFIPSGKRPIIAQV